MSFSKLMAEVEDIRKARPDYEISEAIEMINEYREEFSPEVCKELDEFLLQKKRPRFEAYYDDGDEDRWPRWIVVEWHQSNPFTGCTTGKIFRKDVINEEHARKIANELNGVV